MSFYVNYPTGNIPTFATIASFPSAAAVGNGFFGAALDTNILYESNGTSYLVVSNPAFAAAITALTGDVTAAGPGAVPATIAANAVTYAKFQQVTASSLVGNPTGSTANASAITLGAALTFTGTTLAVSTVPIANGGTGQTTAAAAYNALNPMTTTGDMIYEASANTAARRAIGSTGNVLTVNGGIPVWAPPATSGTVTSVAVSGGTTGLTTSGGPITSSGTITLAGTLVIANGGTGQTTAAAAFNALSPLTTTGDLIYEVSAATAGRLAIGSSGNVLTVSGGVPVWAAPATSGTVTSVAVSGGTTGLTTSGGPITSSGTITLAGTLVVANGGTGVTSVTTSPTATAFAGWDANKNMSANDYITGLTTFVTTGGTVNFSNASTGLYVFTGSNVQNTHLPSTSTIGVGWSIRIMCTSSNTGVNVTTGDNTDLVNLPQNTQGIFTCISTANNTPAAWSFTYWITGKFGTGLIHSDTFGAFTSSLIVNADVNAAAAIAGTKISPNFGAQNITCSQVIYTTGTASLSVTSASAMDYSGGSRLLAYGTGAGAGNRGIWSLIGLDNAAANSLTFMSFTAAGVATIGNLGLGVVHSSAGGVLTSSTIVDADVNATAAIAVTKLAALTASRAVVTDGSGFLAVSATTSTEIGFVSGTTSSIQTQLNAKTTNPMTTTGDIIYASNTATPATAARLGIGATGNILTVSGGLPVWAAPATSGTVTSVAVSGGTTGLTTTGGPITSSGTITLTGTLGIANGGTGQTTANAALNALLPSQTSNANKVLTTNGTDSSWNLIVNANVDAAAAIVGTKIVSNFGAQNIFGSQNIYTTGTASLTVTSASAMDFSTGDGNSSRLIAFGTGAGAGNRGIWKIYGLDNAGANALAYLSFDAAGVPTFGSLGLGILHSSSGGVITSSTIVNADINAAAAIAVTKLAALTASRAVVTDGSGFISAATTTSVEIGYVNGVTSSIQSQLDAKTTNPMTTTGDIIYASNTATPATAARLGIGATSTVLNVVAGLPAWSLIANANVSASAAIAGTKIVSNFGAQDIFGSQNIYTTGTASVTLTNASAMDYSSGDAASRILAFGPGAGAGNRGAWKIYGLDNAGANALAYLAFSAAGVPTFGALGLGILHSSSGGVITSSLIVNADVNAAAAIAGTKIAPNFGAQDITCSQNIYTTGTSSISVTNASAMDFSSGDGNASRILAFGSGAGAANRGIWKVYGLDNAGANSLAYLTTNANGITALQFPATQVTNAGANVLDDYEEGTFTPSYTGTGGSATYAANGQIGAYTKIGNMVTFTIYLKITNSTLTGGGAVTVNLPPFAAVTATNQMYNVASNYWSNLNVVNTYAVGGRIQSGASVIDLTLMDSTDTTAARNNSVMTGTRLGTTAEIILSGTYFTAS